MDTKGVSRYNKNRRIPARRTKSRKKEKEGTALKLLRMNTGIVERNEHSFHFIIEQESKETQRGSKKKEEAN